MPTAKEGWYVVTRLTKENGVDATQKPIHTLDANDLSYFDFIFGGERDAYGAMPARNAVGESKYVGSDVEVKQTIDNMQLRPGERALVCKLVPVSVVALPPNTKIIQPIEEVK